MRLEGVTGSAHAKAATSSLNPVIYRGNEDVGCEKCLGILSHVARRGLLQPRELHRNLLTRLFTACPL